MVGVSFLFNHWAAEALAESKRFKTELSLQYVAEGSHSQFQRTGTWPATLAEIRTEAGRTFLEVHPRHATDVWGHAIIYQPVESPRGFGLLKSYGADGVPGGSGAAADIELRITDYGTSKPWPVDVE